VNWPKIAKRIRVPLGFVFAVGYFWFARPTWTWLAAGTAIAAVGLLLRAVSSGHVQKARELTMTGPYAFVRHPLYLGSIIIAAGFAVAARSVWIAAGMLAMFVVIYWPTIHFEEQLMRSLFPGYDDYARRVPLLFPRLTPATADKGEFSRALYLQHREYNALLGAAAMLAALVAKMLWWTR
jgi:protein-S-isoprenylcysteine O-methyltransferase Ste14